MIEISYVEHEHDENGKRIIRHDPRRGLSDYTIYSLHTRSVMTKYEMSHAGEYIEKVLAACDYSTNRILGDVACEPIACYAYNSVCIRLILFSSFDEKAIMRAISGGCKALGK